MEKVIFGIAAYGTQPAGWWSKLLTTATTLEKYDIQYLGTLIGASMSADNNRNQIVQSFLKTDAEWLYWIDTDNPPPLGAIRRLLDTGKKLVTGLYFLKDAPYTPVMYLKNDQNLYNPCMNWNRGEILPIDSAGMGALLSHRSVFEDIQAQCTVVQRWDGGQFAIHKNDIVGSLPERVNAGKRPKIINGRYSETVCKPQLTVKPFPWFALEYGRTEDHYFFELAARCGHELWVDTSIEVPHMGGREVTGEHYRTWKEEHQRSGSALTVEMTQA